MKKVIILVIGAAVLFAAAYFGYNYLSEGFVPKEPSLSGTSEETSSVSEESSESNAETSDDIPQSEDLENEIIMAPDFTVYDADGNAVHLSDFAGKPVVISFWATWCGYCVQGLPNYEKLSAEYSDEVVFMIINVTDEQSETKEKAMEHIEKNGYTFPAYFDTDLSATHTYGAYSLPATGFVTKSGVFAGGQIGSLPEETLRSCIDQLITLE